MEKEFKEERKVIFNRFPPGDRWKAAKEGNGLTIGAGQTYGSLTDALEAWFQSYGTTRFYIDAREGIIEIVTKVEVDVPAKRFSLYGED
jgi:pectin methylesterase-like acyl-CoA thioesterase